MRGVNPKYIPALQELRNKLGLSCPEDEIQLEIKKLQPKYNKSHMNQYVPLLEGLDRKFDSIFLEDNTGNIPCEYFLTPRKNGTVQFGSTPNII